MRTITAAAAAALLSAVVQVDAHGAMLNPPPRNGAPSDLLT